MVSVATVLVFVSLPAFHRQIHDLTERQSKAFDQQVKAGKVKQAEADRAMAFTRAITAPAVLKVGGTATAALASVIRVFWWAFVLWFLSRAFLKIQLGYLKTLEVAGLGLMINVLGSIVTLLLMVKLPTLFSGSGTALAISDFDAARKSPLLLGVANVFSFWLMGVLSVGLARLANVPFFRAAWFVFAAWLIQESLFALLAGVFLQFAR